MYMLKKKEKKLLGHILYQYLGHNIVILMQNFIFIGISSPKMINRLDLPRGTCCLFQGKEDIKG